MKTFDANFETEKNKKTGASPVWILKIPFVAGTLYLSDRVFTCTGWTIKAWVASWGQIDEAISDEMGSPQVSDFSVDLIIDPDEATDIHDLLWSEAVETLDCELYLWFEGLTVATDPPELIWTGNIIDFERLNELVYNVRLVDESVRIDKYPGRVLSLADYANASLDDVGYQMPILYGAVEKVPALRLDMGAATTISADADATSITFTVTDSSGFAEGDVILIESEQVKITDISGNVITGYRGWNSPGTGTFTDLGAPVVDWSAICAAPNGDVYACTWGTDIYKQAAGIGAFADLGQTHRVWSGICAAPNGDIYACVYGGDIYKRAGGSGAFTTLSQGNKNWWGMAAAPNGNIYAAEYNGDIYMQTAGDGAFNTLNQTHRTWLGMCADSSGNVYAGTVVDIYKQTAGAGAFGGLSQGARQWQGLTAAPNGNMYATDSNAGDIYLRVAGGVNFSALGQTCPTSSGWMGVAAHPNGNVYVVDQTQQKIYMQSGAAAVHTAGTVFQVMDVDCVFMFADHPVKAIDDVYLVDLNGAEIDITASVTKYTGQGGANDLAGYAGKAVITYKVDYTLGDTVLISGDGYQDGGAALIERPDLIMEHFLYTYAAWPMADFIRADTVAPFINNGYKFSVVINTRKRIKEWMAAMAFQCRCWFRFSGGKAHLLYRQN